MESLYVFLAFILGWFVAQILKLIFFIIKKRGRTTFQDVIYYMVKSGGMPSGHTASFTAVTMTIGYTSTIFALAVCNTLIIIYDAINVRHSVGEHGEVLNKIIADKNKTEGSKIKKLRVVEGHTVAEAAVGLILGISIATMIKIFCL